jgi:hypothetical protein
MKLKSQKGSLFISRSKHDGRSRSKKSPIYLIFNHLRHYPLNCYMIQYYQYCGNVLSSTMVMWLPPFGNIRCKLIWPTGFFKFQETPSINQEVENQHLP